MVQLENVGFVRKRPGGEQAVILDGVSFCACPSNITGIVGPSGSGKRVAMVAMGSGFGLLNW